MCAKMCLMRNIYYKEPVYRPPSEARSLLIQVTEGCTHNCSFCVGNTGKKFLVRQPDEIKQDIKTGAELYGDTIRKIFLLDGNAFVAKTDTLLEVANYSYKNHKNLTRIGAYAHASDILRKSDEELRQLSDAGIKILYVGLETGDDELLETIGKRITADEMAEAAHKLYKADITISATIILGLAGNDPQKSRDHAIKTAELINKMKPEPAFPWYVSALTLMVVPGSEVYKQVKNGEFEVLSDVGILEELRVFFEHLDDDLEKCIFRSNHASNYLPLESNNLAKNKSEILESINKALSDRSMLRPEGLRGL